MSTSSSISMMILAIAAKMSTGTVNNRVMLTAKAGVRRGRSHRSWICSKYSEYSNRHPNNCRLEVIFSQAISIRSTLNYSRPRKIATYAAQPARPRTRFPSHPPPTPNLTLRLPSFAHIFYTCPAIPVQLGSINGSISKSTIETIIDKLGPLLSSLIIARKLLVILRKSASRCSMSIGGG